MTAVDKTGVDEIADLITTDILEEDDFAGILSEATVMYMEHMGTDGPTKGVAGGDQDAGPAHHRAGEGARGRHQGLDEAPRQPRGVSRRALDDNSE
jgi:hypothetical protein